jgi:hypothetical protein
MMTKEAKKELLLKLIENWFDDPTGQINVDNCIGFYHYFLDCLEFELEFCGEPEPGYYDFLKAVVEILSDFPKYKDDNLADLEGAKKIIMLNFSGKNLEELSIFFDRLSNLYGMFKEEFLI